MCAMYRDNRIKIIIICNSYSFDILVYNILYVYALNTWKHVCVLGFFKDWWQFTSGLHVSYITVDRLKELSLIWAVVSSQRWQTLLLCPRDSDSRGRKYYVFVVRHILRTALREFIHLSGVSEVKVTVVSHNWFLAMTQEFIIIHDNILHKCLTG